MIGLKVKLAAIEAENDSKSETIAAPTPDISSLVQEYEAWLRAGLPGVGSLEFLILRVKSLSELDRLQIMETLSPLRFHPNNANLAVWGDETLIGFPNKPTADSWAEHLEEEYKSADVRLDKVSRLPQDTFNKKMRFRWELTGRFTSEQIEILVGYDFSKHRPRPETPSTFKKPEKVMALSESSAQDLERYEVLRDIYRGDRYLFLNIVTKTPDILNVVCLDGLYRGEMGMRANNLYRSFLDSIGEKKQT